MDKRNKKPKITLRGVLDGLRQSVSAPQRQEVGVEIEETLRAEHFQVAKTVRHGFPYQPTAMAFDPVQNLLAIGTKTGSLRIFGRPGVDCHVRHDTEVDIIQIIFLNNEGALVTVCADDRLHLWNLRQKHPEIVHSLRFQRERITYCHLPFQSKWLYIGTDKGNLHIVNIESFVLSGYVINWNKAIEISRKTHPGPVVHLSDNPLDCNKLLIGFGCGAIVLWDLKSKTAENRFNGADGLLSIAWHHEGKQFMCSHADGSLATWNIKFPLKPASVIQPHAKVGKDGKSDLCRPISKVEWKTVRNGEPYVIFSGGMPLDKASRTPSLTVMHAKNTTVLEMEHNIVDFLTLCSTPWSHDFQDPYGIVVLLQNDLVVVDLTSPGRVIEPVFTHHKQTHVKCRPLKKSDQSFTSYPCFENPYPMDIHESPVTACQYYADCPPDLVPAFYSVGSKQKRSGFSEKDWPVKGGEWGTTTVCYPEIMLTGHADGSIKFWDASAVTLQVLYKLKTAKVFERHKCRCPDPDDDPFAIQLMELCVESRLLCVAGFNHVILFRFSKQEASIDCPSLEVSIVYEINDELESPEVEYPPAPPPKQPLGSSNQSGSVGSYGSQHSDGKEVLSSVKVKSGSKKWASGYQPDLCAVLTWIESEPPPPITSVSFNSRYGLLAFGNECGLAIVDIVQKTCLLNMGTPDLYGSMDPYSRAPRSPKSRSQLQPQGRDSLQQPFVMEECKSPTCDQLTCPLPTQNISSAPNSPATPTTPKHHIPHTPLTAIDEILFDLYKFDEEPEDEMEEEEEEKEQMESTNISTPIQTEQNEQKQTEVPKLDKSPNKEQRKVSKSALKEHVEEEKTAKKERKTSKHREHVEEQTSDKKEQRKISKSKAKEHKEDEQKESKEEKNEHKNKESSSECEDHSKNLVESSISVDSAYDVVMREELFELAEKGEDETDGAVLEEAAEASEVDGAVGASESHKDANDNNVEQNSNRKVSSDETHKKETKKLPPPRPSAPPQVKKTPLSATRSLPLQAAAVGDVRDSTKALPVRSTSSHAMPVGALEQDQPPVGDYEEGPKKVPRKKSSFFGDLFKKRDHDASCSDKEHFDKNNKVLQNFDKNTKSQISVEADVPRSSKSLSDISTSSTDENTVAEDQAAPPSTMAGIMKRDTLVRRISQKMKLSKTVKTDIDIGETHGPRNVLDIQFKMMDLTMEDVPVVPPIRKVCYYSHATADKGDGSFSRSRSSSMSSLENISKEAISCLTFADAYCRKTDTVTSPSLWVGTSLGSVLVIMLQLPAEGEPRKTIPVIVSPSGTIFRLKGSIMNMSFLDCNGVLIPTQTEQWKDNRDDRKPYNRQQSLPSMRTARMSPTSSTDPSTTVDRQFAIICSEKHARVMSLPSQTCAYKAKITETSAVVRANIISMKGNPKTSGQGGRRLQSIEDSICLACYIANGHIMTFSLPSLKPLLDVDQIPQSDVKSSYACRVAKTVCFSNYGHALYFCSPTEVQKITLSAETCSDSLNEMMGELFLPSCNTPEAPKQSFFKSIFGGTGQLDREELFGVENSGKASKGIAKYVAGSLSQTEQKVGVATSDIGRARQAAIERGEKLGELEDATALMRNEAIEYQQNAHALMLKYRDKKWYQF